MKVQGDPGSAPSRPTVIFLHIGKTAGTSLRQVLRRNYRPSDTMLVGIRARPREETLDQFAQLSEAERAKPALIFGHTVFGIHELVPRPSTYISLVRKPTSLVLSQYRFVLRRTGHRLHEQVASQNLGIEDYIRSGLSLEMDNGQTRAISGDLHTPYGECTDAMLETAKRNIDEHFAVAGLTERFDETLILLQKTFGWPKLRYVRANVAPGAPLVLTDEARSLIAEHNQLDEQLYQYVSERFDASVARHPTFSEDLAHFQRSNAYYKTWGALTHTLPRRVAASMGVKKRPQARRRAPIRPMS